MLKAYRKRLWIFHAFCPWRCVSRQRSRALLWQIPLLCFPISAYLFWGAVEEHGCEGHALWLQACCVVLLQTSTVCQSTSRWIMGVWQRFLGMMLTKSVCTAVAQCYRLMFLCGQGKFGFGFDFQCKKKGISVVLPPHTSFGSDRAHLQAITHHLSLYVMSCFKGVCVFEKYTTHTHTHTYIHLVHAHITVIFT